MNIKYARPETAFVLHEFVKTCLYLQMRETYATECSLLKSAVLK